MFNGAKAKDEAMNVMSRDVSRWMMNCIIFGRKNWERTVEEVEDFVVKQIKALQSHPLHYH